MIDKQFIGYEVPPTLWDVEKGRNQRDQILPLAAEEPAADHGGLLIHPVPQQEQAVTVRCGRRDAQLEGDALQADLRVSDAGGIQREEAAAVGLGEAVVQDEAPLAGKLKGDRGRACEGHGAGLRGEPALAFPQAAVRVVVGLAGEHEGEGIHGAARRRQVTQGHAEQVRAGPSDATGQEEASGGVSPGGFGDHARGADFAQAQEDQAAASGGLREFFVLAGQANLGDKEGPRAPVGGHVGRRLLAGDPHEAVTPALLG